MLSEAPAPPSVENSFVDEGRVDPELDGQRRVVQLQLRGVTEGHLDVRLREGDAVAHHDRVEAGGVV